MGAKTGIEWTDSTWSPVKGCSRISPGCENCYAETLAGRFSGPQLPMEGFANLTPSGARWSGRVALDVKRLEVPLRWKRPRRIFVNSQSDTFHEKLSNEEIAAVFGLMVVAPQHTFQVLTKRSTRMREWFAWVDEQAAEQECGPLDVILPQAAERFPDNERWVHALQDADLEADLPELEPDWPLTNVCLGVSVEAQDYESRIDDLLRTPAALRFVSCEPLLGPLDLWAYFKGEIRDKALAELREPAPLPGLDWVIVGGESGKDARPIHPAWARGLRDQCHEAGVPYFFKQWGEWAPRHDLQPAFEGVAEHQRFVQTLGSRVRVVNHEGGHGFHGEGAIYMQRVGKKAAGSLLDGFEHKAFPVARG